MPSCPIAHSSSYGFNQQPTKRQRTSTEDAEVGIVSSEHPNHVQPLGNSFGDPLGMTRRRMGTGNLGCLPDQLLLDIMKYLSGRDLCRMSVLSPFLYAVTNHDDLWKTVTLRDREYLPHFDTNWKQTYLAVENVPIRLKPVQLHGIYSDVLFQPWLNSTLEIAPQWLSRCTIDRCSAADLTVEMFIEKYEKPRIPVIITDLVSRWPSFGKWSAQYLSELFGDIPLNVQVVDMTLAAYWNYARQTKDETPLYLFEKEFINKMPSLKTDFEVPAYFADDLFKHLGDDRPDYRWIIAGPERSGSTFHQDPNATSAWNALLSGSKKWILFPKHICPPGVIPSDDGAEVMTPLSLIEWFSSYYSEARDLNPYEGIVNAGELMFIPSGMWHCVLNLEPSIAITQNYVSAQNLLDVLKFAENSPDLISGYKGDHPMSVLLRKRINELDPGLIAQLESQQTRPRSSWSEFTQGADDKFCFDFSTSSS